MAELRIVHADGAWRERALTLFLSERGARDARRLLPVHRQAWTRALDQNPVSSPDAPPRVWLCLEQDVPCGVLLGVPFRARASGLTQVGHWGVDLYVPPSRRGRGIGALLLERWRDESPLALGLGITGSAFRIECGLGWTPLVLPPRQVWPLTLRGALTRGQPGMPRRPTPQLPAGLKLRVSPLLAWQEGLETLLEAPGPLDALHPDGEAQVVHDLPFLRWRYPLEGSSPFRALLLMANAGPAALLVYREDRRLVRRKAWWYELKVDVSRVDPVWVLHILLKELADRGLDVVEARFTSPAWAPSFEQAGAFSGAPGDRFIVHVGGSGLSRALQPGSWCSSPWALTLGDSGNLTP